MSDILEAKGPESETITAEEVILSSYGFQFCLTDSSSSGVCRRLQDVLPPDFVPGSASEQTTISFIVEKHGQGYLIKSDAAETYEAATEEFLLQRLQQDIDKAIALQSREKLFVHAGVVGWRGIAIVIPGRSFSGKSTLVAELVRRGAVYYSDEFAVLDDSGNVHPYRRTLVLREDSQRPQDLRLVRETGSTEPLPIGLILAAPYRSGSAYQPAILRGARAVLPLIEGTVLAREESSRILQIAAKIAPDVVTLQGPRPDAAEVAPRILDLIDDAVVSQAIAATGQGSSCLATDLAAVAEVRLRTRISQPAPPRRQLVSARYVRMTDFLTPEEHERVLGQALAHEDAFTDSGIVGKEGQDLKDYGVRKSRTLYGPPVEAIWNLFDGRLRGMLAHLRKELDLPWFPLGPIERQLTVHGGGGFFAPHRDTGHALTAGRRISCVYYFYKTPRRFTGGDLRLYDNWVTDQGNTAAPTYTTLSPIDNSIVFFASDTFHEVRPVQRQTEEFADGRFAITMWIREGEWPAGVLGGDAGDKR